MNTSVKIKKLAHGRELPLPQYATPYSAGMDLFAAVDQPIVLRPSEVTLVPTGISIALPTGFEAQIRPRSGLAARYGITVLNSPGTIDADYRGEIKVLLINHGKENFTIEHGLRIAQMVITRYEHITWQETENLDDTLRGSQGFGSTGER